MRKNRTGGRVGSGVACMLSALLLVVSCDSGSKHEGVYQVYKSKEGYERMMALYADYLSKWSVPYQEIDVETTWGKTHVIKSGLNNKQPLVVLHGGGSNAALTNIPVFARDHVVYNIDIIGEPGKSVPRRIPVKADEVADWLNEVFMGLSIDRAPVLGFSYGAYTGQRFLRKYPDKVTALVMIHYSYIDQAPPLLTIIQLMYYANKNDNASIGLMLEKINGGPIRNGGIREPFIAHFQAVNRYCRQERANMYDAMPVEEVRRVNRPVLIILGEKDPLFDAKKAEANCKQIGNPLIRFEMIRGMGHLPTDHPYEVFGSALRFLKQAGDAVSLR